MSTFRLHMIDHGNWTAEVDGAPVHLGFGCAAQAAHHVVTRPSARPNPPTFAGASKMVNGRRASISTDELFRCDRHPSIADVHDFTHNAGRAALHIAPTVSPTF